MLRILRGAMLAVCAASSAGCLNELAVDTTAGIMAEAEGSTRAYFDWESAGYAAPSGIMQLEGLHMVSPKNERLALTLAKAYMAYAYGWVMDEYELADARADFDTAKHHQLRAYWMYSRARDIVLKVASERDPGLPALLTKEPKTLEAHLKEHWRDREDDLPVLFWLMMTWSSSVNNSPDIDSLIDMPMIRTLAARIAELDAGYEDAGALVFMGGFECSMPPEFGGNPKKGKEYFERALSLTQRKNHIVVLNYAVFCAVALQDRGLYTSLLQEIEQAPDQGNAHRLSNKVAKRRAKRALAKTEELFP
ncbi:MAG TPA: TRAP transporter TatT component family protein [Polyangiales bacterium]|nr:TRAP transporter TatT component family protein [Polyangiales bacterium]